MNGEFGLVNAEVGNRSRGYGRSMWLWEVYSQKLIYLFIYTPDVVFWFGGNKDFETFGKGKVEVKSWRCMVNLER